MNVYFTIIGSAVVFAVVFGFAAYTRYLQHKETMALVEKGLLLTDDHKKKEKAILRWGKVFSIMGLILVVVMVPFAWNNIWILFLLGLLPLALGLGLMLIYVIAQENPPKSEESKSKKADPKPKPTSKPEPKPETKKKSKPEVDQKTEQQK